MFARLRRWLHDLQIADPVIRQQALLLQILLIGMLITIVLAMLLNVAVFGGAALTPSGLGPNATVLLCVAGALAVLRRGRFRASASIVVVVILLGQAYALFGGGVQHNPGQLLVFMIPIVLAGLLIGRPGLLISAGISILITVAAMLAEQRGLLFAQPPTIPVGGTLVLFVLIVGFLALFLDRFSSALHRALVAATTLAGENERLYRAAQDQQAHLQATLASIGDAVITTDTRGRVTFLNGVAERLTGWPQAEAAGAPLEQVFAIINQHSRAKVESPAERVLREGMVVGLANHTLLVSRDGRARPIDDSGAPIRDQDGQLVGVVLVFRDISERKAAEQQQRSLAEVVALLNDSLDYERTVKQIVRFFVPAFADYCLLHVVDDTGQYRQAAVYHPDPDRQALVSAFGRIEAGATARPGSLIRQVLQTGQPLLVHPVQQPPHAESEPDAELLASYRELKPRSLMILPLRARGQIHGALALVGAESRLPYSQGDLASIEQLAERCALALENAELYRAARRAIVVRDQFLAIASHELTTPLTAMLGYTRLLQRRNEREHLLGERDTRALKTIASQGARLEGLINLLLDLSRIETGRLEIATAPVDVRALVRSLVDDMLPTIDQHTITVIDSGEPLIVEGDELRLEQVVQNLLQNAVKYSPQGGNVTVSMAREGSDAVFSVSDQGVGIPAAAIPQLFTRFYRAPNVEAMHISGTGIGLYVVREIVNRHHGTIEVESAEGHGSTFRVRLPLKASPLEQAPRARA
jgi:PAS domain S-box-containing protein